MICSKMFLVFFAFLLQAENILTFPTEESKCDVDLNIQKVTVMELLKTSSPLYEEGFQQDNFMGCLWQKKGLVTNEGVLLVDNFRNVMIKELRTQISDDLAKQKANEAVNYCGNVIGTNPQETSSRMVKCLSRWKVQSFIDNERNQKY